ncbi:hypothetical protein ACQCN2_00865 [Brevibacillus ginsengisoli]|uniref:hypothetical protein n=1 Tax=Brevibacillus ginsengisoli TaxID=363854 RepID=UPI003CEBC53D
MDNHVSFPKLDQEVNRYIKSNQDNSRIPVIINTDYTELSFIITKYVYVVNGAVMVRFHQDYFVGEGTFGETVHQSWMTFKEARMFMAYLAGGKLVAAL